MKEIIAQSLDKSYSFDEYVALFEQVVAEKRTTGPKQTEGYVNYTKLNWSRYQRAYEKHPLSYSTIEALHVVEEPVTLLVITEAWCGDAAQIMPVLQRMDEACACVNFRIVLRDENKELMSQFLTNGGEAIPKVLVLDANNTVVADWGPRPSVLQGMVKQLKLDNPDATGTDISKMTQTWYNADKGLAIQTELMSLVQNVRKVPELA